MTKTKKSKKKSSSSKKAASKVSHSKKEDSPVCKKIQENSGYMWALAAVFIAIVFMVVVLSAIMEEADEVKVKEKTTSDEILFINSVACHEACDQLRPLVKEVADMADAEFREITTDMEVEIPGYMVIMDEDAKTFLQGIMDEGSFLNQMCDITENEDICDKLSERQQQGATGPVGSAEMASFNECLAENGVVIYGSNSCPYCRDLVESLGGHEAANPVYVECTEQREKCDQEAKTGYVPEVQINGEVYDGPRTPEGLGQAVGCAL